LKLLKPRYAACMANRTMPKGLQFAMRTKVGKLMQDANVWLYRKTQGKLGSTMQGAPLLLLTVRGRKSGKARTLPLIYKMSLRF